MTGAELGGGRGGAEPSVRPPVVLLHAFPVHGGMWARQRAALTGLGYQVLTPDQRGFGTAKLGDEPPSLDVVADDLARLLDSAGIERAVVGGLSMGGYVTMAVLRRHPDRVAAIVLADTKASADPEPARANRERIARTVLAEGGPRVLLEELLPMLVGRTTIAERPEVLAAVRSLVAEAPPAAVAWAQRALAARPDSFDTLRGADLPALVVVGAEDTLAPVDDARVVAQALPRASLVVLPGAGHLSAMEVPEDFTAALIAFLSPL